MKKKTAIILACLVMLAVAVALFPFGAEAIGIKDQLAQPANEPNVINVKGGENFNVTFSQALNPFYDWRCDQYDVNYLSLLSENYEPPADGVIGITNKVFTFQALKSGITNIDFGYYKIDELGNPVELIQSETYQVKIIENGLCPLCYGEPLQVEVVSHSGSCASGGAQEGTTAVWDNGDILATTTVMTSVPCYNLSSIKARRIGDSIVVDIAFQQKDGICIQCIGMQKVVYRIISPGTDDINLKVNININGQDVNQNYIASNSDITSAISFPDGSSIAGELKTNLKSSVNTRINIIKESDK